MIMSILLSASKFYLIAVRFTLGFQSNNVSVISDLTDIQYCNSHFDEDFVG